jgi:hypothetical protein
VITPSDLLDSSVASGFRYVTPCGRNTGFQAQKGVGGGNRPGGWRGPQRATAKEAAQDYCDYANGNLVKQPQRFEQPTVDMGGSKSHAPTEPAVIIQRRPWKGATDLYDVLLYDLATGDVFRRKVGITARGTKRYADIAKTFGFSIRPVCKAVTYPTKTAALAAERLRIAEVEADPRWRKVGKECFAPVQEVV